MSVLPCNITQAPLSNTERAELAVRSARTDVAYAVSSGHQIRRQAESAVAEQQTASEGAA